MFDEYNVIAAVLGSAFVLLYYAITRPYVPMVPWRRRKYLV